ncbi:hypothetical protein VNO80_09007 [Phaseolus coccineus]|uniref:TFIIS N-terminal domain-containing protein n=1 Tax=Phaseolus coccineus TaxID=3886 RepID=A0AAN9N5X9_PHACN
MDDDEGVRSVDDNNFIDHKSAYYGSDELRYPVDDLQEEKGEEDEEMKDLCKIGKKRKKDERSPAEIAVLVHNVMDELEVTVEENADLNRQVIMFSSKSDEDISVNRKLTKELVDKWIITFDQQTFVPSSFSKHIEQSNVAFWCK